MINWALMTFFIPTFAFVSLTPGLCMTLSLTLGISLGVKRTLWMMWGELAGVALVATSAVLGVAAMLMQMPMLLTVVQWGGAAYLVWVGVQMWQSKGKLAIPEPGQERQVSRRDLCWQGFVTAVSNPKGWAVHMALLPPFTDKTLPFWPQLAILLSLILAIEFVSLLLYAAGGKVLRATLLQEGKVRVMNRVTGSLMLGVAVWLACS